MRPWLLVKVEVKILALAEDKSLASRMIMRPKVWLVGQKRGRGIKAETNVIRQEF